MPAWMMAVDVVGVIAVAVLVWVFLQQRTKDRLEEIERSRKAEAKLIGRADYVEGIQHFPVILSLTDKELYYENPELQAHLDLDRIEEVEYAHELATGKDVRDATVLRLRSHGHIFEFIIDKSSAEQWASALPIHHFDDVQQGRILSH